MCSDITTFPRQDNFETTLASEIGTTDTSIIVSDTVDFTLSSGSLYATIDPGLSTQENVEVTAISGTTWTIVRSQPIYDGDSGTAYAHSGGASVALTNTINYNIDTKDAVNSKADIDDASFTGSHQVPVFADATARDAAITSPANGMVCYNTDTGKYNDYTGGSWVERESGGTFANASTTVAGKVEAATAAERAAGTATGGTGALLFPTNDALVKTSSGAGDENKLIVLDSAGALAQGFLPATVTSSIQFDDIRLNEAVQVTATSTEVNQALDGISADVTDTNLNTLTAGSTSDADALHTHTLNKKLYAGTITQCTNTTVETTLCSVTVPGNALGTDNGVTIKVLIETFNIGENDNVTLRLKYGSTTVGTVSASQGLGDLSGIGTLDAHLIANSATNAQVSNFSFKWIDDGASTADDYEEAQGISYGTATEDSTGDLTLSITAQWNDADASNDINQGTAIISLIAG